MAKTVAQLLSEIAANIPDNSSGLITPTVVRATLDDIVNSYINTIDLLPHATSSAFGVVRPDNSTITASGGVLTALGGGGGGGGSGGASFSYVGDAQTASIPPSANYISTNGFNTPGDGGANGYQRVSQLTTPYFELGGYPSPIFLQAPPPSITSGGLPVLVCATTYNAFTANAAPYNQGITMQPIFPHWLTILVITTITAFQVTPALPATFTDTAGNVYTLIPGASNVGGSAAGAIGMYYNADPVFVPVGSAFNISAASLWTSASIYVYQFPGFTNAVLDQAVSSVVNGGSTGGVTISTGALGTAQEIAVGAVNVGESTVGTASTFPYTPPAGWFDISPSQLWGRNPISCFVTSNTSAVTYNPTWTGTKPTTTILATFSRYPVASISPSYWEALPKFPMHTASYGISAAALNNQYIFLQFSKYLASVSPQSNTSVGGFQHGTGGDGSASVRFSGAPGAPLVLSFAPSPTSEGALYMGINRLSNGDMISLAPVGSSLFPSFLTAGKRYYVQYATVGLDGAQTIRISDTPIFSVGYRFNTETGGNGTPIMVPGGGIVESGALFSAVGFDPGGLQITNPGSGYTDNTNPGYFVQLTGGSGTGAFAVIYVSGGVVVNVVVYSNIGEGYVVGDVLHAPDLPAGSGFAVTVTAVTHAYNTYAESWTDVVLDAPGVYYSNQQVPALGCGLYKWRLLGHGAKLQSTAMLFSCTPWGDISANTAGSGLAFQTQFQTTTTAQGVFVYSITLLPGNFALAVNYYNNSYVSLGCCEVQGQNVLTNWNNYTFEYCKIRTNNVMAISSGTYNNGTGEIDVVIAGVVNLIGVLGPGDPAIRVADKVALVGLTGTGAFASLNGEWTVSSIVGSSTPFTIKMSGTSSLGASTITGGRLATGTITFFEQIKNNYIATLPTFVGTSGGYSGVTGPATIVQLNANFNQEIELHGIGIYGDTELQYAGLLSLKLVDCDVWSIGFKTGPFPSTMKTFICDNCRFHNSSSEVDKMIDTLIYRNCDFDWNSALIISSASINFFLLDNCRIPNNTQFGISGTPKRTVIRNSFIGNLQIGATYGINESLYVENSTISQVTLNAQDGQYTYLQTGPGGVQPTAPTFSAGTIQFAAGFFSGFGHWNGPATPSGNPTGWTVPGGKIIIVPLVSNSGRVQPGLMVTAFTIQGVRVSGTDFCVDTDLGSYPGTDLTLTATFTGTTLHVSNILPTDACLLVGMTVTGGGLPAGTTIQSGVTLPQAGGGSNVGDFVLNNAPSSGTTFHAQTPMIFLPHPAPRFTCINSTGNRVISQQSGGPPDIPFGSFFKQQFSGGFISAPNNREQCVELIGNLMYCTIDVWKPYTGSGAGTLTIYMCGWHNVSGNYVFKYVAQVIDLTTPGSRTIRVTAAASSPLGADSFVDVPFYMSGGHAVLLSANGGGDTMDKFATFTITGQCFQGIEGSGLLTTTPDGLDYLSDTITQAYVP